MLDEKAEEKAKVVYDKLLALAMKKGSINEEDVYFALHKVGDNAKNVEKFLELLKKRGIVIVKNYKLRLSLSAAIHPFSTFNEIKYKKLGSVYIACAFTVLYFLSSTGAVIWSDFRYTTFDTSTYSSIFAIIQISAYFL